MPETRYIVKALCNECGAEILFDVGASNVTRDEAMKMMGQLQSFQCHGNGLPRMVLSSPLVGTELKEPFKVVTVEIPNLEEHIAALRAGGHDVYAIRDGQIAGVPGLPSNLRHLGYGDFGDDTHLFVRRDAPDGTRVYVRIKRHGNC